jgi:hypothetical protein
LDPSEAHRAIESDRRLWVLDHVGIKRQRSTALLRTDVTQRDLVLADPDKKALNPGWGTPSTLPS